MDDVYRGVVEEADQLKDGSSKRNRFLRIAVLIVVTLVLALCTPSISETSASGSPGLGNWTVATAPSPTGSWYAVNYANGQWIALGDSPDVAVSTDGTTWSEDPVPAGSWHSVAFGDGEYVALSSIAAGPEEMISSDGINWTAIAGPRGSWASVIFDQGRFVAVGPLGQIDISTNGQQWTQVWNHSKWDLTSVTYGNGHFVAVDAAVGSTLISANGTDWGLYPPVGTGLKWGAVTYGNGTFVAFDESGSGEIATSVYGYTWTVHRFSPAQGITDAAFGCGQFIAVGQPSGSINNLLSSVIGATWTSTAVPTDLTADWTSVAYGAHRFVAVDSAGDISWSDTSPECGAIPSTPRQVSGNVANGQIWTYMHPSLSGGGAPVNSYRVTVSDGTSTKVCPASDSFQPNCIIRGLVDHRVYWVTAQAHNRFGYSAYTDPEFVIPVARWSLSAVTAQSVMSASEPIIVQVTGVIANSEGIYPTTVVTVHFGSKLAFCHPNPFGECLVTIANPSQGSNSIYATYSGYGRSYSSPVSHVTITS